jgi:hypothetical protein
MTNRRKGGGRRLGNCRAESESFGPPRRSLRRKSRQEREQRRAKICEAHATDETRRVYRKGDFLKVRELMLNLKEGARFLFSPSRPHRERFAVLNVQFRR